MESNPGGSGQFYSSSKVISYSSNGSGQPKYYEASSETTKGPGGVRIIYLYLIFTILLFTFYKCRIQYPNLKYFESCF